METSDSAHRRDPPRRSTCGARAARSQRHPVSRRRRVRVLALHASTATRRTSTSSCARRTSARAGTPSRRAGYQTELPFPHWLGKIQQRRVLHGRDLQLRQRRRPRGRCVVRARGRKRSARTPAAALSGRGDDLVEGVHPGARALRRRRRHAPAARSWPRSTGRGCSCASATTGACCSATSSRSASSIPIDATAFRRDSSAISQRASSRSPTSRQPRLLRHAALA